MCLGVVLVLVYESGMFRKSTWRNRILTSHRTAHEGGRSNTRGRRRCQPQKKFSVTHEFQKRWPTKVLGDSRMEEIPRTSHSSQSWLLHHPAHQILVASTPFRYFVIKILRAWMGKRDPLLNIPPYSRDTRVVLRLPIHSSRYGPNC